MSTFTGGNDAGGFGLTQDRRFSSQPIPIAGRRLLSAGNAAALPAIGKVLQGSLPSGYTDHGSCLQGKVEVAVDVTVETIDLGRIASPSRYYVSGQKGTIKADLQEYQPEIIDLAAGNTGVPTVIGSGPTGSTQVYIGGKLGTVRRVLVLDDFDVDFANDDFLYSQYWWTTPNAQCTGSFTLKDDKSTTVIPITYQLLVFEIAGVNRMLEQRAINHS